jgi:hypothetical protein
MANFSGVVEKIASPPLQMAWMIRCDSLFAGIRLAISG